MPWSGSNPARCCPSDLWSLVPSFEASLASWPCVQNSNTGLPSQPVLPIEYLLDAVRVRRAGCTAYELVLRPQASEACLRAVHRAARRLGATRRPLRNQRLPRWRLNGTAAHAFLRRVANGPVAGDTALCITGQMRTLARTGCGLRALLAEPLGADIFVRLEAPTRLARASLSTAVRALAGASAVRAAISVPPRMENPSTLRFTGARCYVGKRPRASNGTGCDGQRLASRSGSRCRCAGGPAPGLPGVLAMWSHWRGCLDLVRKVEKNDGRRYRWVAYARTDWQLFAPLPVAAAAKFLNIQTLGREDDAASKHGAKVAVPMGESYDGVNDRFALATRTAAEAYGGLLHAVLRNRLMALRRAGGNPHSEGNGVAMFRSTEWNSEQALGRHLAENVVLVSDLPLAAATLRAPSMFGYPGERATCCAVLAAQLRRDGDGRRLAMGRAIEAAALLRGSCCPPAHAEAFIREFGL